MVRRYKLIRLLLEFLEAEHTGAAKIFEEWLADKHPDLIPILNRAKQ